jgi:HSP20 family protein
MFSALYKPFKKEGSITNEINKLAHVSFDEPVTTRPRAGEWLLPVNIKETKYEVTYTAELPGLKGEELKISIDDDVLTIHGEKKRQIHTGNSHHYQLGEKFYGSVIRTIKLPADIIIDNVEARFLSGTLKIRFPKLRKNVHTRVKLKTEADLPFNALKSKPAHVESNNDDGAMDLINWSTRTH